MQVDDLAQKKCVACEGFETPLNKVEAEVLLRQVPLWILDATATNISKTFTFKDFMAAMRFADAIAEVAEQEGHHPDLTISWGKVGVTLTTHAIKGLSQNDFILAAKIDQIPMI